MNEVTEEVYTLKTEKDPESGAVISRTWFNQSGNEENPSGPSHVRYDPDTGAPVRLYWKINGQYHRDERDGPARIRFDPNDGGKSEEYMWKNQFHRIGGPAIVISNQITGEIYQEGYFREGIPSLTPKGIDLKP